MKDIAFQEPLVEVLTIFKNWLFVCPGDSIQAAITPGAIGEKWSFPYIWASIAVRKKITNLNLCNLLVRYERKAKKTKHNKNSKNKKLKWKNWRSNWVWTMAADTVVVVIVFSFKFFFLQWFGESKLWFERQSRWKLNALQW